jgi:inhibitor of KinA
MQIEPLGDSALLVRVIDQFERDPAEALRAVLAVHRRLETASIPGAIELAPAYTTVAVFFDLSQIAVEDATSSSFDIFKTKIEGVLAHRARKTTASVDSSAMEVPVCYAAEFAPDLAEVALHAGLSEEEVVSGHSSAKYRVNCVGFTPGFPFLSGLPARLATPRRATPRKEIPAGSVAIGGAQTGIYPRKSPGGWNIIGRTPLQLFDIQRESPALFHAGDHVRFRVISREEFEQFSSP